MTNKRALHPEFREAYVLRKAKSSVAVLVGCPRHVLARWMNAPDVAPTPLTMERLTHLASVLDYTGPLFKDEAR